LAPHTECNKNATRTDILKDPIPANFLSVQNCYLDMANTALPTLPIASKDSNCDTSACILDSICKSKLLSLNCPSDGT